MGSATNFSSIQMAFWALAGGLALLLAGGEILVAGATRLAGRLGMSPLLIGLTVVAFGTSMPEMFVSLIATLQGYPDIMVGNVVGSNLFNLMMVMGLTAVVKPFPLSSQLLWRDLPIMLGFSAILIPALALGRGVTRVHGLILLLGYGGYLLLLR